MANSQGEGESDGALSQTVPEGRRLRADELLPLVRAAIARGEGPRAVLAWVRRQKTFAGDSNPIDEADDGLVKFLAERLAATLNALGPCCPSG